jgi:hypothetical protein
VSCDVGGTGDAGASHAGLPTALVACVRHDGAMKALILFLIVLLIIGGGMKVAGMQIPIFDYPLGGPMAQPVIHVKQAPDLHLP